MAVPAPTSLRELYTTPSTAWSFVPPSLSQGSSNSSHPPAAGSSSSSFAHVAPHATSSGSSNLPSRLFSSVPSVETREWLAAHGLTVSGLLELMNRPTPDDSSSR